MNTKRKLTWMNTKVMGFDYSQIIINIKTFLSIQCLAQIVLSRARSRICQVLLFSSLYNFLLRFRFLKSIPVVVITGSDFHLGLLSLNNYVFNLQQSLIVCLFYKYLPCRFHLNWINTVITNSWAIFFRNMTQIPQTLSS